MKFVGGIRKTLGLWTRKAVECFKQILENNEGETGGGMLKIFQRKIIFASDLETILMIFWQRIQLLFFCCPKNLPEAKLKNF